MLCFGYRPRGPQTRIYGWLYSKHYFPFLRKELDQLVDPNEPLAKQILSPSEFFLSKEDMSPDELSYLDTQDKLRRRVYQETARRVAKRVADKPKVVSDSLKELKEQTRVLKEVNQQYLKKKPIQKTDTRQLETTQSQSDIISPKQPSIPR